MKTITLFIIMVWVLAAPCAWASSGISLPYSNTMHKIIYGATIDSKIAFYQKRIYLTDSEFTILADIGKDAKRKIAFLKTYKQHLIKDMIATHVKLTKSKLNSFLGTKIHEISASMEAYSSE